MKKLLVVDDSPLITLMYQAFLKSYTTHSLDARYATDGLDALARLNEDPNVDLIILDINMPGMNGLEFVERMKLETAVQDIPVVMVSTEDEVENVRRGLGSRARAYLAKPFGPKELHRIIDDVLAGAEVETVDPGDDLDT